MSRYAGRYMLYILLAFGLIGGGALQIFLPARRVAAPAVGVVREFMRCRLSRDEACARAFLTQQLHAKFVADGEPDLVGGVDPHYQSYRILSREEQSDGSWIFRIRINEEMAAYGPAGWFEEEIRLLPVESTFLVAEITPGPYYSLP